MNSAARIGICLRDLPDTDTADLSAVLDAARDFGFTAVQFPVSFFGARLRTDAEVARLRQHAESAGVEIWLDLGQVNATRPERSTELLAISATGIAEALVVIVDVASGLGSNAMTMYVGTEDDRFDRSCSWTVQLDRTAAMLADLAPRLRSRGSHLLVKTHEEISTFEAVQLVECVGSDVLAIAFDPVNVVIRMENPTDAAQRVQPYVGSIHFDDAIWFRTALGFERRLCPVGQGSLDWPGMLTSLTPAESGVSAPRLLLDIHRARLAAPYLDADWDRAYPDVTPEEASVLTGLITSPFQTAIDLPSRTRQSIDGMRRLGLPMRDTTLGPDSATS